MPTGRFYLTGRAGWLAFRDLIDAFNDYHFVLFLNKKEKKYLILIIIE